jgi:acyl-CoA thioester hydrolase
MHINMGGHLDSAMVLSIVTEARNCFYKWLGYRIGNIEGLTTFAGDAAVQYLSEAFYGEVMLVEMAVRDFNKYGWDLVFRISDKASGREVARGKTGMVFYDKQAKKAAPVPEGFRKKFLG